MFSKVNVHVEDFKKRFSTKGSFTQNLAITFSGNVAAQLIGFLFTPFIARIYGPEAYGVFALFMALISNISPVFTLQYPTGYVSARTESDFYHLLRITLLTLFLWTFLGILALSLFSQSIMDVLNIQSLQPYLWFFPLYFFLMGIDSMLLGWNIRLKEFSRGATAKIASTIASKGFTVLWGYLSRADALGIIAGNLILYPIEAAGKLSKSIVRSLKKIAEPFSWAELKQVFIRYKSYPLYVTSGLLLSNFGNQLPVYFFSFFFHASTVGLFALANSIVTIPLNIIVQSTTTVFLQKASETYHAASHELAGMVKKLYSGLYWVSIFPLAIFALTGDFLFTWIFGNSWTQAGVFASLLAVSMIMGVSATPLTVLFRIMHREKTNMIINVVFIAMKFTFLLWGIMYDQVVWSVIGYSVASWLSYVTYLFVIFKFLNINRWVLVRDSVVVGVIFLIIVSMKV